MGLFDWLTGKQQQAPARPVGPKLLAGLDEDSMQVLVDTGDSMVTVMDREMYEYMSGKSSGSDPVQHDLDEMLPNVTRVRAVASGMFRGRAIGSETVLETSDPASLSAFRETLRIVEDPSTFTHCGCLGGPTLELFSGNGQLATIGLQHGHSIRWSRWKHDARLRNGSPLNDWLMKHGVDPEFLDALLHNQYDAGGMMPLGVQRSGPRPLSRGEQQVRLAELSRIRGGDLAAAAARCQRVIDSGEGQALAYAVRGLIRDQQGDREVCVADLGEAIRLDPAQAEFYFSRAVALDQLGRREEAVADCTAALKVDREHVNALNSRGLILMQLGRFAEAMADLDAAIRLAPKWGLPYLNRSQLHIRRGDQEAAIADCSRVIEVVGPSQAPADRSLLAMVYWNRGQCHRQRGDADRAEADFQEARRLNPQIGVPSP